MGEHDAASRCASTRAIVVLQGEIQVMSSNISSSRRLRQQRWRRRQREGVAILPVEVDLVRTVEWLKASGLLDEQHEDDRAAVAAALWRAASLSILAWERENP